MLNFDVEKMLFRIPKEEHDKESIIKALRAHPEVQFVSLV